MKFNKKGAMFGLDARIALAIFGALSVISGAALYSAIQQAKAVQWQTYFNELAKASKAYYLDTGRQIPFTDNTTYSASLGLSINDLVINESNMPGWQGPYWQAISYGTGSQDYQIKDVMTNTISSNTITEIFLRQTSSWDSGIDGDPIGSELCIVGSNDCSEWFTIFSFDNSDDVVDLFNMLDGKIDDGDGSYLGRVRFSSGVNKLLFVQGNLRIYRG